LKNRLQAFLGEIGLEFPLWVIFCLLGDFSLWKRLKFLFFLCVSGKWALVTPIDVNALLNTLIPIIFLVMIVSVITGLVREMGSSPRSTGSKGSSE
jgi:hypothetical protein